MIEIQNDITFLREEKGDYEANLFICHDYNKVKLGDLEYILSDKERDKYNNFLSLERKTSFLFGRYCAKKALARFCNISKLSDIDISQGIFGYPIIEHKDIRNIQVSISHSKNVTSAVVSKESHPASIDIEMVDGLGSCAIQKQLTKYELDLFPIVNALPDIFSFVAWTAKESLSKMLKTGLTIPITLLEIDFIKNYKNRKFISTYKNFSQYKTISHSDLENKFIYSITIPRESDIL